MKQVVNEYGQSITGLFRTDDGALIVKNETSLEKSRLQHNTFSSLNKEIDQLKGLVKHILERLDGKPAI